MGLLKINEYLNAKGKTDEKAVDIMKYQGEKPKDKPAKYATSGKNYAFSAARTEEPIPYVAKTIKPKDQEGLGSIGTPGIDFEKTRTNVVNVSELHEHCGCEKKKAPMVVAYSSGAYHPDPIQAIKYIVYLTNENENILKALMHEAKKSGCLKKYTDFLYNMPELYQTMSEKLSDEEGHNRFMRRLSMVRNESTDKKKPVNEKPKSDNEKPENDKKMKQKGDDSKYSNAVSDFAASKK